MYHYHLRFCSHDRYLKAHSLGELSGATVGWTNFSKPLLGLLGVYQICRLRTVSSACSPGWLHWHHVIWTRKLDASVGCRLAENGYWHGAVGR